MKKTFAIFLCIVILLSLIGCKENSNKIKYKIDTASFNTDSSLSLDFDDSVKSIILTDTVSGKSWSTVLKNAEISNNSLKSPLNIKVSNDENLSWEIVNGYDSCVAQDDVKCEKINNGYIVNYKFDAYGITVPVKYELANGGLKTTVMVKKITESGKFKLVSVSLSPNLCSVKNNSDDSYLFIPTGSGALMDVNETVNGARTYQGEVLGTDYARLQDEYLTDEETVRLPVFGAKEGNNSLFGIIDDSSAASSWLNASAGDPSLGYSDIYSEFFVRGYDVYAITSATAYLGGSEYRMVSDKMTSVNPCVSYYVLSGGKCGYNEMASFYRDYLIKTGKMQKSDLDKSKYLISFIGGVEVKDTTLGIPHYSTEVLTEYSDIFDILGDISKSGCADVRLLGFGDSGISPGKVGGGFNLSKIYGTEKGFNKLKNFCDKNGQLLTVDFDIVRYNKSGNGFSSLFDIAKTASSRAATLYPINPILRTSYKDNKYYLLSRNEVNGAILNMLQICNKKKLNSVSLLSFTEMLFSDYNYSDYYLRANSGDQINDAINKISKKGITTFASSNYYSAVKADALINVPLNNGEYFAFSKSVPFYQTVFHGYKPLYSYALNSTGELEQNALDALSTGTNLSFSFIGKYDTKLQNADLQYVDVGTYDLYSLLYKNNSERVKNILKKYLSAFEKINDAQIVSYEINGSVSQTKFSNGLILYANHSENPVDTKVGLIDGYSFKFA